MGHCQECGARAAVHEVEYRQNTGMVFMRQSRVFAGTVCRSCSGAIFRKTTLHNFVFGWWGTISMIVTPFFILNNLSYWWKSRSLAPPSTSRRAALEDAREYATHLLASKDEATVVEVLAKSTGAPEAEVAQFVKTLA